MTVPTTTRPAGRRTRLLDVALDRAALLTTPLLPDDYLGLLNPLWTGRELRARVEQLRPEAAGAATLVLQPGRGWRGHTAGQWIRVGVDIDGVLHWRSYSLTTPPRTDGTIRITVKPTADGFVSRHLVHHTPPGTVLRLQPAAGEFTLPTRPTGPLLLLTAGSGITPVMGMLRFLVEQGPLPDVVALHCARDAGDVIFGAELRDLDRAQPGLRLVQWQTGRRGRLTPADLDFEVPDWRNRETWACGPAGLLDALEEHWAAADLRDRLHTERFQPKLAAGTGVGGTVTLQRTGRTVKANASTTLLDAGESAGALMPSGCRMGICFSCVVPLLSGRIRDVRTGEVHGEEGDLVQTCINTAAGPTCLDV